LELIGKRIREVLPDGWASPGLFECYVHVAETGEQGVIEAGFTRNGISSFWENIVTKLDDGVAVWFPDIPSRKRAADEVRRSEAYLAHGQRISHTGSWGWNVASPEISFWSLEHFRIFGLESENNKVSYQIFFQMVHADERAQVEREFQEAVRAGRDFEREYRIVHRDGQVRCILSQANPVFGESRELTEYMGTVADVTEQRQGEESSDSMQAELAGVAA